MTRLPKILALIAVLATIPSAAMAWKPIDCSQCTCRTACTTPCKPAGGVLTVCFDTGWCQGMPVCYGTASADAATSPETAFLASLAQETAQCSGSARAGS